MRASSPGKQAREQQFRWLFLTSRPEYRSKTAANIVSLMSSEASHRTIANIVLLPLPFFLPIASLIFPHSFAGMRVSSEEEALCFVGTDRDLPLTPNQLYSCNVYH